MKSRRAVVTEPGVVAVRSGEVDEPGPGELLLQAKSSTLSPGTEHSLMAGDILPLPQPIGYSMAARVVAVGEGIDDVSVGDHVVTTGEHADLLVMDRRNVTPVPENADLEQAAFFNLAHTAMYAIRRSGLQLGEPALVLGQGLVGAITARLAQLAGALPVIATDVDDTRLEMAKKLGVHYAVNAGSNPEELDTLIANLGWGGVPVVFEATGLRQPLEQAVNLVSERGRIVMMSAVHGGAEPAITGALMMKGASLIGGYINSKPFSLARTDLGFEDRWPPSISGDASRYVHSDTWTSDADIRVFLDLLRYRSLDLGPLISHRFIVDDIPRAYDMVWNRDATLLGGVIRW